MNLDEKIENILSKYGDKIIIAAHHYQKDEIVKYANLVGDSYKLAVECSKGDAEFIVLCGVYFMAQSAALLAKNTQYQKLAPAVLWPI
ncbi:MAG: quinolinate synthase NadA [Campylobacter hyointestinalis]